MDDQVFRETISEIVSAIKRPGMIPMSNWWATSKPGRNIT